RCHERIARGTQVCNEPPLGDVPEREFATSVGPEVTAPREGAITLPAYGQLVHVSLRSLNLEENRSGLEVPHPHDVVLGTRDGALAVRRDRDGQDSRLVPHQIEAQGAAWCTEAAVEGAEPRPVRPSGFEHGTHLRRGAAH